MTNTMKQTNEESTVDDFMAMHKALSAVPGVKITNFSTDLNGGPFKLETNLLSTGAISSVLALLNEFGILVTSYTVSFMDDVDNSGSTKKKGVSFAGRPYTEL